MSYEIARNWRLKAQRYRLIGEKHGDHYIFPPRDICPYDGQEAKDLYEFSGKGEVYSSTVIYEAPAGFEDQTPYQEALIKLDEGPMITAQLTDLSDATELIPIGTKVEMVTRVLSKQGNEGLINYGYKFRIPVKTS